MATSVAKPTTRAINEREKRKARHAANEAARPADKRLVTRQDLDDLVARHISNDRLQLFRKMKHWFEEFLEDSAVDVSRAEADAYFRPHGRALTVKLIRQYLFYLADGRVGQIRESLSLVTILNYTIRFFGAVEYFHIRKLDADIKHQVIWWLEGGLAKELSLHRIERSKPVAHHHDVTLMIETLYSPRMMASFAAPRQILNLNLFINVAIDSCGRIGEIVPTNSEKKEQCLHWEDIEFYILPPSEGQGGTINLWAKVTFRWQKGKRLLPSDCKTIVLHLLPPNLCLQDTLRQLLLVALLDGIFVGNLNSWEQLSSLRPAENGSMIRMKPDAMNLPVLRQWDRHTEVLTDEPLGFGWINKWLRNLGRMCGLRETLTRRSVRLSRAGEDAVRSSADYQSLLGELHDSTDAVIEQYGSLALAKKQGSALYKQYLGVHANLAACFTKLATKRLEEEYQAYVQKHESVGLSSAQPAYADDTPAEPHLINDSFSSTDELNELFDSVSQEVEQLRLMDPTSVSDGDDEEMTEDSRNFVNELDKTGPNDDAEDDDKALVQAATPLPVASKSDKNLSNVPFAAGKISKQDASVYRKHGISDNHEFHTGSVKNIAPRHTCHEKFYDEVTRSVG